MTATEAPELSRSKRLEATLAPGARQRISEFLASFRSFEPALGLLYGDIEGVVAGKPSWSLVAFPPVVAEDMVRMYASFGAVVSHELDGFDVIVPQIAHAAELEAGVLDFVDNRLCATAG